MPPAEARLWNLLRMEPLRAHHFPRQVPLGPYYAGFASHSAKLVVEVDGWTHSTDAELAHDRRRDAFIRNEGYGILRVINVDVMENLDGVMLVLMARLEDSAQPATPTLDPSPQGGGR
jgi:very-short-patch-repair endonuclease